MFKTLLDQRVLFLMKSAISAGILGEGSPDTEMRGQSTEISKDREGELPFSSTEHNNKTVK